MIITSEKYDSLKLDKIKRMLEVQQQAGSPMLFEIIIDGFMIINKTEKIEVFDSYEDMIDSSTQSIEVLVYPAEKSRAYRKYIFEMKEKEKPAEKVQEKGLGQVEVDKMIDDKINLARERWEMELLRKDLAAAQKELEATETFCENLMNQLEEAKKKNAEEGNSGNIFSGIFSFIKESAPNFLQNAFANKEQQAPLSGAVEQNTQENVSFKKKENTAPLASNQDTSLSDEEKNIIENAKLKQRKFSPDELHKIDFITEQLSRHKHEIDGLYHALQIAKENQEKIEKEHRDTSEKK